MVGNTVWVCAVVTGHATLKYVSHNWPVFKLLRSAKIAVQRFGQNSAQNLTTRRFKTISTTGSHLQRARKGFKTEPNTFLLKYPV